MTQRNDGGAAYPSIKPNRDGTPYHYSPGMSLLDAAALAMLPAMYTQACKDAIEDGTEVSPLSVALTAHDLAEAFVAARERT